MAQSDTLVAVVQAIGADIKAGITARGALSNLSTTAKSNLVAAINEVLGIAQSAAGGGVSINDSAASTTTAYSSSKTDAQIAAAISALINGAPAAYDTLKEIADYIANDTTGMSALTTAINNRVRFDDVQTLTTVQQQQACANLGVGDPTTDFLGAYNAAKA